MYDLHMIIIVVVIVAHIMIIHLHYNWTKTLPIIKVLVLAANINIAIAIAIAIAMAKAIATAIAIAIAAAVIVVHSMIFLLVPGVVIVLVVPAREASSVGSNLNWISTVQQKSMKSVHLIYLRLVPLMQRRFKSSNLASHYHLTCRHTSTMYM